jgi:bacterioferritin
VRVDTWSRPALPTGFDPQSAGGRQPLSIIMYSAARFVAYNLGIMKGNPTVLEHLNHALRDELTAINQYFLHAEMSENWGYKRYSKYIKKQSIDEMKHAELLLERILFLDGTPKMAPMDLTIGKSVKDMIESDLKLEHEAVASYNESIRVCVEKSDNGSRDLFMRLLRDEEGHDDWLESQVHQIQEIGYERYLITQTEEE